ncbi:MAG: hypothetical protein KC729_12205, partial [Candidatus Eisenbacteria bacterium]|nr:hypothetical protein [Candidatus Eisenbacteria bacterium]
MAQIDQFIDALFKHQADGLVMEAGQKVTLLKGGSRHPVTAKEVTPEQLERMLESVREDGPVFAEGSDGTETARLASSTGAVEIAVSRASGALRLTLTPLESSDGAAAVTSSPGSSPSPSGNGAPGGSAFGNGTATNGASAGARAATAGMGDTTEIHRLFRT